MQVGTEFGYMNCFTGKPNPASCPIGDLGFCYRGKAAGDKLLFYLFYFILFYFILFYFILFYF